jgi:formate-dependent nitrite reductase membrane component NrfD
VSADGGAGAGAGGRRHDEFDKDRAAARAVSEERNAEARSDDASTRDTTPALGTPASPASWQRAEEGAAVALHVGEWRDGRWSYLYGADTQYGTPPTNGLPDGARHEPFDEDRIGGPMIHSPVWTWEVPLYFWFGGMAAGSSFVALACDLAGDEKSARIARRVSFAVLMPSPPLLIADLGRPARFLNMLRIFKPRSPMSMGSWALMLFSTGSAAGVGLDLLGRHREAKAAGAFNAVVGGYFGSYTGVLLASTAVPVWSRSRLFLGPIFVATATATGAAATRLTLVASGLPDGHPTRRALGTVETLAMTAELVLSEVNERRLGELASGLEHGRAGQQFTAAKWLVRGGLGLRFLRGPLGRHAHDLASVMYLAAGALFRFAWIGAGRQSGEDDVAVARDARRRAEEDGERRPRGPGSLAGVRPEGETRAGIDAGDGERRPRPGSVAGVRPDGETRAGSDARPGERARPHFQRGTEVPRSAAARFAPVWADTVRRVSLLAESILDRRH